MERITGVSLLSLRMLLFRARGGVLILELGRGISVREGARLRDGDGRGGLDGLAHICSSAMYALRGIVRGGGCGLGLGGWISVI